ncbi:MAG: ATP-binding cassette, subfamily bacterial MsbA [Synergistales bacterium]|jgi:subfamily B ATP-binding cassette protein MsbA|nr:ATP-binding cassette, subfamily bacterial MsbA [Synergistales bacterium]
MKGKKGIYLRLLSYARPYIPRLFAALGCMVLASACNIVAPWLLKNVVDDVLINKNMMMLNFLAVGLVLLYAAKNTAYYGQQYLMNWVGQKVVMDIRLELYDHTQRMSLKYLYGTRVGELISRITNDVTKVQEMITTVVIDIVVQSISFVGMIALLLFLNWKLTVITFIVIPIAAWVLDKASRKLRAVGHDIQRRLADLSASAYEAISAVRIVRSFATEDQEFDRFREQNRLHFKALMKGTQVNAALTGVIETILVAALAVILWFGGRLVVAAEMTPGELVAFLGYLALLVQPIRAFSRVVARLQQGLASADRIFEIIDTESEVTPPKDPVYLEDITGRIDFEGVCFAYRDENWVLCDVDISIEPGEKVALVGPTGAGKSTLADMIPRFYDPQHGSVRIDGVDVRRLDFKTLRRQIGIVPQDPVLLKGSIAFNIGYGLEDPDPGLIREAARVAGIHPFIESLPEGYETEVGERGVTLSGGQRQRLAIARAVVRNPRILILDEATSSLDAAVEQEIQEAMRKAMKGRTSIIIAHRLSTVREADRIIVLDKGKVVEEGTHEQLQKAGGLYAKLCAIQFGDVDAQVSG